MHKRVYIDLSEFAMEPCATGIQRVAAQLCVQWPDFCELAPVRITPDGMHRLPPSFLPIMHEYFRQPPENRSSLMAATRDRIRDAPALPVSYPPDGPVLVPEVFYAEDRLAFYRDLLLRNPASCSFIAFDFLPLTNPEYFAPNLPHDRISGYFRLLRTAARLGFISEATKRVYYERLQRKPAGSGPVLWLGADGLSSARCAATMPPARRRNGRPHFCAVGTIEPRKNHLLMLEAFECARAAGVDLELVFLGRFGWLDDAAIARIRHAAQRGDGFRLIESPSDEYLRDHVLQSTATVYLSSSEGYGLPPVESLWLGVPVIASNNIPSLEQTGGHGVHTIPKPTVDSLCQAFQQLSREDYRKEKEAEARDAKLGTWRDFAAQTASWVCDKQ